MGDEGAAVVFPINRGVLWSREPTAKPHYVHAREVVPPLFVNPKSMSSLLKGCAQSNVNNVEKSVTIVPVQEVVESARSDDVLHQRQWKTWLQNSTYALTLSEDENDPQFGRNSSTLCGPTVNSNLTIPVSCRSSWKDDLTFDKETTR